MRSVEEILRRYRPAPAPGAAAPAGVPGERTRDARSELAPVFAALSDTVALTQRRVDEARLRAAQIRVRTEEEVREIQAAARSRAEQERTAAAVQMRDLTARERARIVADAQQRAARIRGNARPRIAALVAQVEAELEEIASEAAPESASAQSSPTQPGAGRSSASGPP